MKHYISPIAKSIEVFMESAVLSSSDEIPLGGETDHFDAPKRMHGDWPYEWEDAFADE